MTLPTSFAILALLASAAGQVPPVFRADVEMVRVDVAVTKDGEPVLGLRAGDFEVRRTASASRSKPSSKRRRPSTPSWCST